MTGVTPGQAAYEAAPLGWVGHGVWPPAPYSRLEPGDRGFWERVGSAAAGATQPDLAAELAAERERADKAEAKAAALAGGIDWVTSCLSCAAETSRREGAEGKLAEAVLLLGEIRETVANFLGQYGDSDLPMFRVGQDLANATLKIIDADAPTDDDENGKAGGPGDEPLTHFFHCWRFPDHHRCAVALIERQSEENDHLIRQSALAERAVRESANHRRGRP